MTQPPRPTLVDWPFWNVPFWDTPRGYLCKVFVVHPIFCVVTAAALTALGIFGASHSPEVRRLTLFVLGVAAVTLSLVLVLPKIPIALQARRTHTPWRAQWLVFEARSIEFQRGLMEGAFSRTEAYDRCPTAPPLNYLLFRTIKQQFPEHGVPLDGRGESASSNQVARSLSKALYSLSKMGGPPALGRFDPRGIIAIFKVVSHVQLWVLFRYFEQGSVLVPEALIGVHEYYGMMEDAQGFRHPGDLVRVQRRMNLRFLLLALFAFPPSAAIASLYFLGKLITENVQRNQRTLFRSWLCPDTADPADYIVLARLREKIPGADQWFVASKPTEEAIETMKRRAYDAINRAFAEE